MDEFVKKLLISWNLSSLIPKFEGERRENT
jgi:hypothetical protein